MFVSVIILISVVCLSRHRAKYYTHEEKRGGESLAFGVPIRVWFEFSKSFARASQCPSTTKPLSNFRSRRNHVTGEAHGPVGDCQSRNQFQISDGRSSLHHWRDDSAATTTTGSMHNLPGALNSNRMTEFWYTPLSLLKIRDSVWSSGRLQPAFNSFDSLRRVFSVFGTSAEDVTMHRTRTLTNNRCFEMQFLRHFRHTSYALTVFFFCNSRFLFFSLFFFFL